MFHTSSINQWFHWVGADWVHRPYNRLGLSGAWAVWCPTVANSTPGIWLAGVDIEPRYTMAQQVAFFSSGCLWVVIFLRLVAVGFLLVSRDNTLNKLGSPKQ